MTAAWQVGSPGPPVGSAIAEGTAAPAPIAQAVSATTILLMVLLLSGQVVDARSMSRPHGEGRRPYASEKSAVFGICGGGVPITIAISFPSVSSIARGSCR